jgi:PAS domain S-box-containing protein
MRNERRNEVQDGVEDMATLSPTPPFESEQFVRSIAAASPDWIYVFDLDARGVKYVNRSILAHLGYGPDKRRDIYSLADLRDFMLPEDAPMLERLVEDWRKLRDGEVHEVERRLRHKDGSPRYFAGREVVFARNPDGTARLILGMLSDITPRKKGELALRESEERLNRAQAVAHIGSWYLDVERNILSWSAETYRLFGLPPGSPMDYQNFLACVHAEDRPQVEKAWRSALRGNDYAIEHRIVVAGTTKWVREQAILERNQEGKLFGVGTVQDITYRKRTEEELRASEERFRELAANISECLWIASPDKQQMIYVSPAYETIWGRSCQSLLDQPASWLQAVHPEDRERVARQLATQRSGNYDIEYRVVRPDEQVRWVHDRAFPVRDKQGQVTRIVGVVEDITKARALEEQFRQAQKMEAIGRLAGGVAHDFNNLLTVIGMQAESAQRAKGLPPPAGQALAQIREACDRAADLTQQLLLFSRRQALEPRDLDLNELVTEASRLLSRIIGEDIDLEVRLHPSALSVYADRSMLDQILLNLTVNARDAMPKGGRLLIETDLLNVGEHPSLAPGLYVRIKVTDTGLGISEEVLPRVFEPFFTTKESGKGTGLGLATVFGIVQQHKGFISVSSKLGVGTSFEILLPANPNVPKALTQLLASDPERPATGSETVLLVEDEPAVRKLVHEALDQQGYRVHSAANGLEALRLWRSYAEKITLLITDLVLPEGLGGMDLVRRLRAEAPSLKVICTSGYQDCGAAPLSEESDIQLIHKPFSCAQLLETIRKQLEPPLQQARTPA